MKQYRVYFDLEATGLSKYYDRIVQIGAVVSDDKGKVISVFDEWVKPDRKMSAGASKATGIVEADYISAKPTKAVILSFFEWIKNTCDTPNAEVTFVAYNGFMYDFPLLLSTCHRWGIPYFLQFKACRVTKFIDPLKWGRKYLDTTILQRNSNGGCSYKQGDVYRCLFQRELINAHRALDDAQGLRLICEHINFSN